MTATEDRKRPGLLHHVYERYRSWAIWYAGSLGAGDDAPDIVQEVFLRFIRQGHERVAYSYLRASIRNEYRRFLYQRQSIDCNGKPASETVSTENSVLTGDEENNITTIAASLTDDPSRSWSYVSDSREEEPQKLCPECGKLRRLGLFAPRKTGCKYCRKRVSRGRYLEKIRERKKARV